MKLKTSFAIGAAVEAPDPPCSMTIEIEYLEWTLHQVR